MQCSPQDKYNPDGSGRSGILLNVGNQVAMLCSTIVGLPQSAPREHYDVVVIIRKRSSIIDRKPSSISSRLLAAYVQSALQTEEAFKTTHGSLQAKKHG